MFNNLSRLSSKWCAENPFLQYFAKRLLSWKTRRLIFLSSLYGAVCQVKHVDEANAERLVKALNIAKTADSIVLPVAVKSVIWSHRVESGIFVEDRHLSIQDLCSDQIQEADREALARWIVKKMPLWLRYAKSSQMLYDVKRLAEVTRSVQLA